MKKQKFKRFSPFKSYFYALVISTFFSSFAQFFNNINKWADMAHLPDEFRRKIDRLKDTFGVAHNTFKRFYPIFSKIFASPNSTDLETTKQHRNRKLRYNNYPM